MSLPTTTSADLDRHLRALGVTAGKDIVVHSRLASFGRIEGGAAAAYRALRRVVGPEATIAAPTYTFDQPADCPFDPLTTASSGVGALSEYLRRLQGAVRSRNPLHSHAAVGPAATLLADTTGAVSFGPGSDFAAFRRAEFSLLLLGCDFHEGATFVHHVETLAGVPYRGWMDLTRAVILDGVARPFAVRYFGRTSDAWAEDHRKVQVAMIEAGLLRTAECPFGRSHLAMLGDVEACVSAMLRADPYAVVRSTDGAVHTPNVAQQDTRSIALPAPFALVASALTCDLSTLSAKSGLGRHPRWDSLGHVAVLMVLETHYGVELNDETIRRYEDMGAIVERHRELAQQLNVRGDRSDVKS